ncbi:envelope integrity protein Cei [Gordonia aurantiaca]|uniref:envelope integrity protein Cei n=1 Tax=Gordonia sp. B21 TaxID=3151852 RepID=UPI00326763B3
MVSKITTGYPTDEEGRPYKRRRYAPVLATVAVLAVLGVIVWSIVLTSDGEDSVPVSCNQPTPPSATETVADGAAPPPPAPALTRVPRDEMLDVAPAPLSSFQVRVLNASGERGAARSVSEDLAAHGFTPAPDTPFADDTVYPDQDLDCVGQIRFGPAGRAAAAAAWLALPCAELIDDGRRGTQVDIALGVHHSAGELSQDAQAALEALRSADPTNPETGADPVLVKAVHDAPC